MPTEIRIVVSDDPISAMYKFSQAQKGKYKFSHVERSEFVEVELHRPQQVTIDPEPAEITPDSFLGMLPLETRTIKVLREAHKCIESGRGKNRTSNIVRQKDMDIKTVGDLLTKTEADLLEYYEIGPKRIAEIKLALQKCNPAFELAGTQNSLPLS